MTVLVLLAVVSPALRDRDSFPLSTYPMYASARPDSDVFSTVVGVDAQGARIPLSLRAIARTDDALVAQAEVERRIGAAESAALCRDVAQQLAEQVSERVDRVEVVTERHDLVALVAGEESLLDRDLHATCELPA